MSSLRISFDSVVCGYKRRLKKGSIVAREWRIVQKLGEGGFGSVYKVVNVETRTYVLRRLATCPFVPHILGSGKKLSYSYLIMDLLGPSLNKILKLYGRICSISTQVRIGINILYALKQLHDFGFIHRDLKPANVAVGPVGTPQFRFLHIFDFGLAREYIVMPRTGPPKMRRPRPRAHFRGTLRYCSVNTHQKGEQGRDDDLWCLLYMLVELRGPLPWAKVRTLNYYIRPNYALLYQLLLQVMEAGKIRFSDPYDWEMKSEIHTEPGVSPTSKSQMDARSLFMAKEYNPFPAEFFSMDPLGF